MKRLILISLLFSLGFTSCATTSPNREDTMSIIRLENKDKEKENYLNSAVRYEALSDKLSPKANGKDVEYIQLISQEDGKKIWSIELDNLVDLILKNLPKKKQNVKVKLKLEDVSIEDFINTVFGKILNINYIVDDSVKKQRAKISINLEQPISLKRFLYITLSILSDYGVQPSYDYEKKLLKFWYSKEKQFISIPIYFGKLPSNLNDDDVVFFIYPARYVNLGDYANFINKFIVGNFVRIDFIEKNKFLTALGRVEVIKRLISFLRFIDRPIFKEKNIAVLNLYYIDPTDFIRKIKPILVNLGVKVVSSPSQSGLFLYPLSNRVLMISPKKEWIDIVVKWKSLIDNPDSVAKSGFYVYKPRNRSAEEIAKLLESFRKSVLKKQRHSDFEIILDKTRNQIILSAEPKTLKILLNLLKQIDTLPKQVLVETTIAEITLKDQLQYGLEWYLKTGGYLKEYGGTLGGLGIGGAGFTYSLVTRTEKFQLLMNAFAKKNMINILSSPHIVVVNGKSANINVGTEVPVISSEVSAPDITTKEKPSILRNVEYRNTGVQLSIQPSIISDDTVELKVSQSVSDAQSNNLSKIDSPIILNRSISTEVVVRDGESVVLGGLISRNYSHTTNKVPVVADIPILGNLFKTESKGGTRTELVVIITPHILNTSKDYSRISFEIIRALSRAAIDAKMQVGKEKTHLLIR